MCAGWAHRPILSLFSKLLMEKTSGPRAGHQTRPRLTVAVPAPGSSPAPEAGAVDTARSLPPPRAAHGTSQPPGALLPVAAACSLCPEAGSVPTSQQANVTCLSIRSRAPGWLTELTSLPQGTGSPFPPRPPTVPRCMALSTGGHGSSPRPAGGSLTPRQRPPEVTLLYKV